MCSDDDDVWTNDVGTDDVGTDDVGTEQCLYDVTNVLLGVDLDCLHYTDYLVYMCVYMILLSYKLIRCT